MAQAKLPVLDEDVAAVLSALPEPAAQRLRAVRKIIFNVAEECGCGELIETTKWGQIAYLPRKRNVGTTIRLGATAESWTLYVHCQTTLVSIYRSLYPDLIYEGKRAIVFPLNQPLDTEVLSVCIDHALTYHLRKRDARQGDLRQAATR